jgi:hypothetical protein
LKGRYDFVDMAIDWRIILKRIVRKWDERVWNGFIKF